MHTMMDSKNHVGPVLKASPEANAVVAAIIQLNPKAVLIDRGSYLRVLAPDCCRVTREAIEQHLGKTFELPGDLEKIMCAFKGSFHLTTDEALWEYGSGSKVDHAKSAGWEARAPGNTDTNDRASRSHNKS